MRRESSGFFNPFLKLNASKTVVPSISIKYIGEILVKDVYPTCLIDLELEEFVL